MLRAPVSPLASVGPPPLVRRLPERRAWRRSEGMSPGPAGPRSCFTPSPQSDQRVISMYQSSEIDALSRRARESARDLSGPSQGSLARRSCLATGVWFSSSIKNSLALSRALSRSLAARGACRCAARQLSPRVALCGGCRHHPHCRGLRRGRAGVALTSCLKPRRESQRRNCCESEHCSFTDLSVLFSQLIQEEARHV